MIMIIWHRGMKDPSSIQPWELHSRKMNKAPNLMEIIISRIPKRRAQVGALEEDHPR